MRCWPRLVSYFLLASLVLHLGDWPYIDEILADTGSVSELAAASASSPGAGFTTKTKDTGSHSGPGYQLLVPLQGLPSAPIYIHALPDSKTSFSERTFLLSLIPPRITRPPAPSTPS
jgi:hypothetical protein